LQSSDVELAGVFDICLAGSVVDVRAANTRNTPELSLDQNRTVRAMHALDIECERMQVLSALDVWFVCAVTHFGSLAANGTYYVLMSDQRPGRAELSIQIA